ncbi:MAG: ATP-binding protein, partial [Endomicrobium sp.]|nr:ATP-binding protein [Endomicrobium sp.]
MKILPIGTQTFEVLRNDGAIYVDKTEHIYKLINSGSVYFLSRPRRFGKSLLISTFKELFKGNKKIFEGLYIYGKWDWSKTNPLFLLTARLIGYEVEGEVHTDKGRIDAVLKKGREVIVVEIKHGKGRKIEKLLKEAMAQIKGKKYYEKYGEREVSLLAIAFGE